jgi:hypothetical protein
VSNSEKSNDPFGIADALKQFTDVFNEGVERAKRQSTCKIRRFYHVNPVTKTIYDDGVAFPSGLFVLQSRKSTKGIRMYQDLAAFLGNFGADSIQWIDPEVAP